MPTEHRELIIRVHYWGIRSWEKAAIFCVRSLRDSGDMLLGLTSQAESG